MTDIGKVLMECPIRRFGLIQASAGTGKTWTLEHLFVELMEIYPSLEAREILTVTFTDKAAGELRDRIQKK